MNWADMSEDPSTEIANGSGDRFYAQQNQASGSTNSFRQQQHDNRPRPSPTNILRHLSGFNPNMRRSSGQREYL